MIVSMTGFGKVEKLVGNKKISIEIKSLNSKNADFSLRIPLIYKKKEIEIRQLLLQKLIRGKVELGLFIENLGNNNESIINKELIKKYMEELQSIVKISDADMLAIATKLPDVCAKPNEDIDEAEWKEISNSIPTVIEELIKFRIQEGNVLKNDFENRLVTIDNLRKSIEEIQKERKEKVIVKLRQALQDMAVKVDENRFEQELIYYLEKLDITEELVRLENHVSYFKEIMENSSPNGKKLGFIGQEIGREINTIGSKANDASMQKLVIQMKDELEKIKEQLLNVL